MADVKNFGLVLMDACRSDQAHIVVAVLAQNGFEVGASDDVVEIRRQIDAGSAQFLVVDLDDAGSHLIDFIGNLADEKPEFPIYGLGSPDNRFLFASILHGVSEIIHKPAHLSSSISDSDNVCL